MNSFSIEAQGKTINEKVIKLRICLLEVETLYRNFDCVINFLRTGVLHLGEETCVIAFQQVRFLIKQTCLI